MERAEALVEKVHAVVLSDYAKGALTNELVRACDSRGAARRVCRCWRIRRRRTSASIRGRRRCVRTWVSWRWRRALPAHEAEALLAAGEALRERA